MGAGRAAGTESRNQSAEPGLSMGGAANQELGGNQKSSVVPQFPASSVREMKWYGGQLAWGKRSFPLSQGLLEVLTGHPRETKVQRGEGSGWPWV